ncbi:MAG: hypothetical protein J6B29_00295 [Clostridia bacterium]|nr:hypothetical protein [Clostridia bacterium]
MKEETKSKKAKKEKTKKVKDKFRRVRSISPMARIVPYIMENRVGSQNFIFDKIPLARIEKYIKEKQNEGYKNFNLMHILIAAYVRTCSQRPAINRFIRGQKIYTRRMVEVSLVVKKEMSLESPDTVVKILLEPDATAIDVYNALNDKIEGYREVKNSGFDRLAKVLNLIPGIFLRWTVRFLRFLDYLGLLPRALTSLSPFHASFFITSMGSLGIPPIVHHLYDFGTVPTFCAFGAKQREFKVNPDGSVYKHCYVDVSYNLDERICDGFYYASALRYMKTLFKNPEALDSPPEIVYQDVK